MEKVMEYADTFSQDSITRRIERVACYIRVSTQEQKLHGISLSAQRDKLKEYANKHGLKIVEWYEDEGVSGRKRIKNRPALQRMIKDAQAGKFDRIIFIKLDRFFRSIAEYHECMKLIDPVLWTATEEKYDLTTANGRAFVNMKITIAELEADQGGERIRIVNEYKVKTGQALAGSNSQGYAYTVEKVDGVKKVVPDPKTKEIVMEILNYYITHQNKKETHKYIMNKFGNVITYRSMGNLLQDTKLYGRYRDNPNYCEPYIDKATFDKIQALLKRNIKHAPSGRVFLFSGLLTCPCCGNNLSGCSNGSTHKANNKVYHNQKVILSYKCNKAVIEKKCTFRRRPNQEKIEAQLLNNIDYYVKEYMAELQAVEDNKASVDNELLEKRIKELKSEMKNTTIAFRKNRMTEKEYDKEYDELEKQLKVLEDQLEPVKEIDFTVCNYLLESDWKEIYKALTPENRRAFWRKYIKEIKLDAKTLEIKPIFF